MRAVLALLSLSVAALAAKSSDNPAGWSTCGGLTPMYNRTACPADGTCCTQRWAPAEGNWGCCPHANAVCCSNGYTCCPSGTKCVDSGHGWSVVTTCEPADADGQDKMAADLGNQVCKQGAPIELSTKQPNILVIGDSVSIGYTPYIASIMAAEAFVQHSPWGGDGGAEESQYGWLCLDYLLRAPNGTPLKPDVIMFNWGLHNCLSGNNTVPGQGGPPSQYAPYLEKIVQSLKAWGPKLLFAITSPVLCNAQTDAVNVQNNQQAIAIMRKYDIPTVDLYHAITGKCGPVPTASCFGEKGCWCPHCPPGYEWLANSTIVPVLRDLLHH